MYCSACCIVYYAAVLVLRNSGRGKKEPWTIGLKRKCNYFEGWTCGTLRGCGQLCYVYIVFVMSKYSLRESRRTSVLMYAECLD